MHVHIISSSTAGLFALGAVLLSLDLVYRHVRSFHHPHLQRQIIRIVLMVPVYAIDSFLSLVFTSWAGYFDTARDCYEGYVLYSFFKLCTDYLGGVDALGHKLEGRPPRPHLFPFCWLEPLKPGPEFLSMCKAGVLQFVFVKPFMAFVALILHFGGLYEEGNFRPTGGYLYQVLVNNVSVSLSMYFLMLFYLTTHTLLRGFAPLPKFACVKAVIFVSFWQGVLIAILVRARVLRSDNSEWSDRDVAVALQDFIICVEMLFAAWAHRYAFSVQDLPPGDGHPEQPFLHNILSAMSVRDVVQDAFETFHPQQRPLSEKTDPEGG